jgi:hypothetical protein
MVGMINARSFQRQGGKISVIMLDLSMPVKTPILIYLMMQAEYEIFTFKILYQFEVITMMRKIKFFKNIFLFIIILSLLGCSSSSPVIKPDDSDGTGFSGEHIYKNVEQDSPANDIPSLGFKTMRHLLDLPIEAYVRCYSRVPRSFEELENSGLLMGIPKAPFANQPYQLSSNVSVDRPWEFSYYSGSDTGYEFSYVTFKNDIPEVRNLHRDETFWTSKLISLDGEKASEFCDAKIGEMMEFFSFAFYLYYIENKKLPTSPEELFSDYELIPEAWNDNNIPEDVYFEFGVDSQNNKIYAKYRYSHGFKKIYAQKLELWDYTNLDDDAFAEFISVLSYDETPDPDKLILNPWFTFDNLESVCSEIVN